MKIYTKTGDDGTTALFDGTRVSKNHPRVCLYGEIDELNGQIGLGLSFIDDKDLRSRLIQVQKDLFALGAQLANPAHKKQKDKSDFDASKTTRLESEIDEMEANLPAMTNFILPGGHPSSAALHVARCLCRNTERSLITFREDHQVDDVFVHYLNRLSDYLFVTARICNKTKGQDDTPW